MHAAKDPRMRVHDAPLDRRDTRCPTRLECFSEAAAVIVPHVQQAELDRLDHMSGHLATGALIELARGHFHSQIQRRILSRNRMEGAALLHIAGCIHGAGARSQEWKNGAEIAEFEYMKRI